MTIVAQQNASEVDLTNGVFRVTRDDTQGNLTVYYSLNTSQSTASSGSDFSAISGSVVIPDGFSYADIAIATIDDSEHEGEETVVLNLESGCCCGGGSYTVGSPGAATLTITDDDPPPNQAPSAPTDDDAAADAVNEGAANGTAVGITALSTDPESTPVTYSLTDDAGGRFQINATTGVVSVADGSLIDFESSGGSYGITVRASDGDLTADQAFSISVNNVAPTALADDNASANEVDEGADNGTLVGLTIAATDPAGGTVTYSLIDDAGGRFQIDSSTGVVTIADGASVDFESSAGSYAITVRASDGSLDTDAHFTITVNNVAPAIPADADEAANAVDEGAANGTIVGITATSADPGGGSVTYALTDDAGGRFQIDPQTGVVTVAAEFVDFETSGGSYILSVVAIDGELQSSEVQLEISVNNVAPGSPTDQNPSSNFVFVDSSVGGSVNLSFDSADPSGGPVSFSLTDNAGGRFQIHSTTGVVSVADPNLIDIEDGSYLIRVVASDGSDSSQEAEVTITVATSTGLQVHDDHYFDSDYLADMSTASLTILAPGVLANDHGVAGATLTLVTSTAHGELNLNGDGSFSYTPSTSRDDHPGSDFFVYQLDDGVDVATATVHISVVDPYEGGLKGPHIIGRPPANARVIAGPGRMEFTDASITFVSNNTSFGDWTAIWWQGAANPLRGNHMFVDIGSWSHLIERMDGASDGSVSNIYISGHGAWQGGIQTQDPENRLIAEHLTLAQAAVIQRKLAPGGRVFLMGCQCGGTTATMQLAQRIGVPVVGNTGDVEDGNYGYGSWVQFDPP